MTTRIPLPSALSIYHAGGCRAALLAAIDAASDGVDLLAMRVEQIDAAGVQLLLAAQKEARRRDLPLRLVEPSAALRSTLDMLGLSARFEFVADTGEHV